MLADRLTLSALLLTSAAAGWSFYRFQRNRLVRRFAGYGVEAYTATLDNGQVRYWAGGRGDGPPLLLIHGFGGDAMFGWAEQMRLAKDAFVVAPDLLWFGESHSHMRDFTPDFQAKTFIQLLDHLAIERADVVGISYGGFVAGSMAHAYPDRVRRLVIVDSPGHTYTMADYHAMLDRLGIDSIADLICPTDPRGVQRLLQLAYYRPPPVPMFVAKDVFASMYMRWRVEKIRLLDELLTMAEETTPESFVIRQPSLILWGDHDELFPVPLAHRLADAVEGPVRVQLLKNTNHAPNMESPGAFNRAIREFLG